MPNNWPSLHFLTSDLTGISAAFALFSLLAFFPGYALGWLANLFSFRTRQLPFRFAVSVPLSIAITPVLGYTVGLNAVWFVYAALCVGAIATGALRQTSLNLRSIRSTWPFAALVVLWLALALISLADLPLGHRLYFSVIDFDYCVRIAFTHSLAAFGLPARTPFFFPGHPVALRYHYFWILVCAQICRLGAPLVDARQAFIAGTLWVGIGMISLIPLYLRLFSTASRQFLRRSRIGIALLAVTGLDIVPALFMVWLHRIGLIAGISPSVEWWNEQVDGWLYTMLWEPHYVCALVACLTGFLLVWTLPPQAPRRQRLIAGLVAGLAFTTAAGSGLYVALVFAVFLALWFAVTVQRKEWWASEALAIAGGTSLLLIRPYFATLLDSTAHAAAGPPLLTLAVRAFLPAELALRLFELNEPWHRLTADLVFLPLNYFLELGAFFLAAILVFTRFRARKQPATRAELTGFLMVCTSVVICTFVKSSIIANNDLGWRGFLPAQFMLLLWTAEILADRNTTVMRVLLALGLLGTVYDLAILRFYPLLSDMGRVPKIAWIGSDQQVGLRTAANREAYEWLRAHTPETAIIQQNPEPALQDTFYGVYAHRQTIATGAGCTTGFGGDPKECAKILPPLIALYAAGANAQQFQTTCQNQPIDVILARDTDAAWNNQTSWVWTQKPLYQNPLVRLYSCK